MNSVTLTSLRSMSVSIYGDHPSSRILTPDFLSALAIVPSSWGVVDSTVRPSFSQIEYHNRVLWRMESDSLSVHDYRPVEFGARHELHRLVCNYLRVVTAILYEDVFLTFRLPILWEGSDSWFNDCFLGPLAEVGREVDIKAEPGFSLSLGNSTVDIRLSPGGRPDPERPDANVVIATISSHYGGVEGSTEAIAAIESWPEQLPIVASVLDRLFEGVE